MALAPRNAPCPCGSGRKYKKCCGFDRDAERMLEDRALAAEEIARLPYRSPRLLPLSDAYDAWARSVLDGEVEPRPADALATIAAKEERRIVSTCAQLFPDEWAELSARCADTAAATAALLAGAAAAGIRDCREPLLLDLIEDSETAVADPFEALALALDGESLWSFDEGRKAERAIEAIPDWLDDDAYEAKWHEALERTAVSLATEWHRRRLRHLVRRVEARLPLDGFPRASAALREGCRRFATDDIFRKRLAGTLLSDLIGRDLVPTARGIRAA